MTLNEKTGRVLLITDKTLGNIEFRRNGLLFRDRSPAQQDYVTVLSKPDPTFPWLGHFIFHNLEANNGFPIEVLQLLNQKEIPCERISKILIVIGMKDELYRSVYRNKTFVDNVEDACSLVETFLQEASNNFPEADVIWLGLGKLKSTSEKYSHINNVAVNAQQREWPERIHFDNIFHGIRNCDIKDKYGKLNVAGVKKIVAELERAITK